MLGLDHQRANKGTIERGADSDIFGRAWRDREWRGGAEAHGYEHIPAPAREGDRKLLQRATSTP